MKKPRLRSSTTALALALALAATFCAQPARAQEELVEQWVSGIIGTSSSISTAAGSIDQLLFEPNASSCELWEDQDFNFFSWRAGVPDRGEEWVELRYDQPVFATAVEVYESLHPGAVTRILVRDFDGALHEVWAGQDPNDTCPAVLRADFEPLSFAINIVRIELNTALVPGFNQLDAVKLIGAPVTDFEPLFVRLDQTASGTPPPSSVFGTRVAADLDNDGWPDIVARDANVGVGSYAGFRFVQHNEGNGTFHFRGPFLPVPDGTIVSGSPIAADFDNDGDLDLFYASGNIRRAIPLKNLLLRNDRGTFIDITAEVGLMAKHISGTAISFDYDRDGWLDLYVGNWTFPIKDEDPQRLEIRVAQQNMLYRNQGDGTFVDATSEAGLDVQWHEPDSPHRGGTGHGFIAADFNDDGWTDLYVVVPFSPNRLLFNDEGRFREAESREIRLVADSFGAAAGDIDNDGDLDLFQAAAFGQSSLATEDIKPERSTLFLNLGDEQFLDVTEGVGLKALNAARISFARFFDFDNDADLDLFPVSGLSSFFENRGDLSFVERPFQSGLSSVPVLTDFDGDGWVDVSRGSDVFRNQGLSVSTDGTAVERRNHHYLTMDLVGTASNRDGIGAQVFATTGSVRQRRDLMGGDGWFQHESIVHFGLGQATSVDQLEVRWPSGQVDFISAIPADQHIRIVEGRNAWYPAPRTIWEIPPPERAVFGQSLALDVVVRPALFEPSATFTSIRADLSGLGGPEEVPLIDLGDGTYRLQAEFVIGGDDPLREVEVLILQETSLGEYWTQLTRHVEVEGDPFTAVLEDFSAGRPDAFALSQNFPNPFNSGTVIRFALPRDQEVELAVYNLAGQQVAMLVEGRRQAGSYAISWDGRDESGRALATGMYFYRLQAGGKVETRKLMLLR